jgi:hypothetical protein
MKFPSLDWDSIKNAIKDFFSRGKKKEVVDKDTEVKKRAKKLLDFYSGNQEPYLKGLGFENKGTGDDYIKKMILNITKKIIDRVSMVYKYPPERELVNQEGEPIEKASEYQRWINYVSTFDNVIGEAEKQKNLFHKVLHRTHYNPVRQEWKFLIEWDYRAHFVGDDPLNPVGYSVPLVIPNENLKREHRVDHTEQVYLYYDDDRYFYYNTKGEWWTYFIDDDGNEHDNNGKNIYGVSPFNELYKGVPIYQYDTIGALDLITANQSINQNLNNLNMALHYQGFGVIWDNSGLDQGAGTEILVGPTRQVHVPQDVTINNLDLNPKILEMIDAIKFQVQAIANIYNLNVNWHQEATPVSGFSLIVQNMDYIEQRQKDVDEAKLQEKNIFRTVKAIQKYHKKDLKKDEPIIPQDSYLSIDFTELDLPINQAEAREQEKYEIELNLISVLDAIKSRNPDMDDVAAKQKLLDNKKDNGSLTAAEQIRENLTSRGVTIEE